MPSSAQILQRTLAIPPEILSGPSDKANTSPITPAVTGILYPTASAYSATEPGSSRYEALPTRLYRHPNVGGSTLCGGNMGSVVIDENHLDQLWGTIRQQKEHKMAKERPKVQSLEEPGKDASMDHHPVEIPVDSHPTSGTRSLKKKKTM